MSDSSLVEYRRLTKKYTRRLYPISKITIHHSASVHTGKQIADFFAESTKAASANYCIGVRGDIALSVPVPRTMAVLPLLLEFGRSYV